MVQEDLFRYYKENHGQKVQAFYYYYLAWPCLPKSSSFQSSESVELESSFKTGWTLRKLSNDTDTENKWDTYKMWTLQPNSGAVTIFVVLIRSTKALCCCRLKSKVNVKLLSWQVSKLALCIAGTNMSVGYLVWNFVWAAKPWVMHQVYIPASK